MIKELLSSKPQGSINTIHSDAIPEARNKFIDMVDAIERVKILEWLITQPSVKHDPNTTIEIKRVTEAGLLTVIFSADSSPLCATLEEV